MDLGRRETPLFLGVGILVAAVAILFFGVTITAQQVAYRKQQWQALQQQVAQAQRQMTRRVPPEAYEQMMAQQRQAAALFVTEETLPAVRARLESLAQRLGAELTVLPSLVPCPPAEPLPGFERCYQVAPVVVTLEGRYRHLVAVVAQAMALGAPAVVLRSGTITPIGPVEGSPRVKARLVFEAFLWVPGALPKGLGSPVPSPPAAALPPPPADGRVRDPFDPRWLGPTTAEGLTLNGILWDPRRPTCALNDTVVGVGDVIQGYTVVAILPTAVLLRGPNEPAAAARGGRTTALEPGGASGAASASGSSELVLASS